MMLSSDIGIALLSDEDGDEDEDTYELIIQMAWCMNWCTCLLLEAAITAASVDTQRYTLCALTATPCQAGHGLTP